jgi:ferredoxin
MARWSIAAVFAAGLVTGLLIWLIGERGRLILPSTRRALQAHGWWRIFTPQGVHFFLYGCWPWLYLGLLINHVMKRLGVRGGRFVAERYHGKVLTTAHARSLLTIQRPLPLQDLEQIIPYATARQLVLQAPPDIALIECPCRQVSRTPCQPSQVCMVIGQPFVDLVLEHHPRTSRRVTVDEALEVLDAEHRRGHLHSAWFKDACLNRFFAICNCCTCCCGGIQAMRRGIPMLSSSGYVAEVDPELCQGCGRCRDACPFLAIEINGRARIDLAQCMGCGVCVGQCRHGAVALRLEPSRGVPLDVDRLAGEVPDVPVFQR